MATEKPQSFENHTRLVPGFHMVALGILAINVLWCAYRVVRMPSVDRGVAALVAVALIMVAVYARNFALTAQDRVIRLEMGHRLRELLPPELAARAQTLNVRQLIALRFAGDDELPALTAQVLDQNIQDSKTIKKMIRNWRPDHLRV